MSHANERAADRLELERRKLQLPLPIVLKERAR